MRKDTLVGETVEERDRQEYQEKLANLEEYKRIRDGLFREEIVTEAEYIPPRSRLNGTVSYSVTNKVDAIKILAPNSALHIALVREQVIVAIGLSEPKEVIEDIKKKAA